MENSKRLSVDRTAGKRASAKGEIPMEELEDQWLADQARATLKKIRSGKEKTIPWKKIKRDI